jgi:hypothetical protein
LIAVRKAKNISAGTPAIKNVKRSGTGGVLGVAFLPPLCSYRRTEMRQKTPGAEEISLKAAGTARRCMALSGSARTKKKKRDLKLDVSYNGLNTQYRASHSCQVSRPSAIEEKGHKADMALRTAFKRTSNLVLSARNF